MQAWGEWKSVGALPFPGDMGDQPAFVVDAFLACEAAAAHREEERPPEKPKGPEPWHVK